MLWENTDFIDGAVRSRVFCQLYQYDNCVSGRKDAVNRRIADRLWQIGPLVPQPPRVAKSAAWECTV